jgi:hypothetical protein
MALSKDPFSVVPPDREQIEMTLARGAALREFVALESALARTYVCLVGKNSAVASAEFLDLTSHQRIAKLQELISACRELGVDAYFSSLLDDIKSLTKIRNFIVHARQIMGAEEINLSKSRRRKWAVQLIPPDIGGSLIHVKMNSVNDVVVAVRRFAYVSACLDELHHYLVMRALDNNIQTPAHFGKPHEPLPKPGHRHYSHYAFDHYGLKTDNSSPDSI